jgi:D-alanyl-D-alanine carboxypeptidase/D-alanyl-D-alanine-endopeptidase (penicillin-binding protein 4)
MKIGSLLRVAGVMAVAWVGAAPAAETKPKETFATVEALRARIEAHVSQPRFAPAAWGVKIASLDTGKVWFEHHADRLLSPASNCKLFTGAMALDKLGGDYRIVTPIFGTVKPGADGVLQGDVIVSGRGDPSWKVRGGKGEFEDGLAPLIAVLERAGVKRITGSVVADATWFRGVPNGAGWTVDDLNDDYGAEISAVSLEENFADMKVAPGARVGAPAELSLVQPHTGLMLDNRTTTIAKEGKRRIERVRLPGEKVVHVFGEVPLGEKPELIDVPVPRPAQWLATALTEALRKRGIAVEGLPRSVRWPETTVVSATSVKLGEVTSPPLRDLVTTFMKPSQNLETDLIFGHVGELSRTAETPVGRTTEELGVAALQEFLKKHGLPVAEVRFEEGSGLSRNNLASANATVALLTFMTKHREAKAFEGSLPVAGVDGTLRRRMKGTPAEGKVQAKTGTLRYASSLGGYVTTAAGERLVFCLMLNRHVPPTGRASREEVDEVAVWLAGFGGK